jgi:hypothetical protein
LSLSASRLVVCDYVVSRALVVAALAVRDALVLLAVLGVLEDDVPRVEQAGKYAETAECDVDERVCRADAALDPDCENCQLSRGLCVDVQKTGAWRRGDGNTPPIGGNRKDRTMRKQSVPHILTVDSVGCIVVVGFEEGCKSLSVG